MPIPTVDTLTPAMLSAIAGAIISLTFRFVPGAADWFAGLTSTQKQLFMLGITSVVAACIGLYTFTHTDFSPDRLWTLLFTLYTALSTNQMTYQFIRRS